MQTPARRTHIGWIACALALSLAEGCRSPKPPLSSAHFDLFLSSPPAASSLPSSTLHEAWHVALPDPSESYSSTMLAVHGGAALLANDDALHAFDARTGGPVPTKSGVLPKLLLLASGCVVEGYSSPTSIRASVRALSAGAPLWTQALGPPPCEPLDFVSTLRGPGTTPDYSWAGRTSIRISAQEQPAHVEHYVHSHGAPGWLRWVVSALGEPFGRE